MACEAIPLEPLSDDYGFERGTPLDRRYIEEFLARHRDVIQGSVLEVGDPRYCDRFGDGRITERTIVDIDTSNPQATLIVDLSAPRSLRPNTYDCVILTETLHLLASPESCIENCHAALRTGGSLLVTVPTVKRMSPSHPDTDYWRFTPAGLELLFHRHWPGRFEVSSYGNLRVCVGFLLAHTVEDFDDEDLTYNDARFPLKVAVHARRD